MTLGEIIEKRGRKYDEQIQFNTSSDYWKGYMSGWKWAYQDLKEILEQNGFSMDIQVIEPKLYMNDPREEIF